MTEICKFLKNIEVQAKGKGIFDKKKFMKYQRENCIGCDGTKCPERLDIQEVLQPTEDDVLGEVYSAIEPEIAQRQIGKFYERAEKSLGLMQAGR